MNVITKRRLYLLKKPLIFLIATLWLSIMNSAGFSQENLFGDTTSISDSLSESNWSEETIYSIEMIRLERWIRENTHVFRDTTLLKEIVRLKREAENFAVEKDFTLAVIWLETIWNLLLPEKDGALDAENSGYDPIRELDIDFDPEPDKKFNWSNELSTGVDLWQLEFQMASFDDDTTSLEDFSNEGSGNPYTGLRISFDYTANSRRSIQGYTFLKYIRDYLSGEAELRFVNQIGHRVSWNFAERFEGNTFYRDNDLKYIQNISTFNIKINRLGPFVFDIEDELLIRRYADESNIYPSYINNSINGLAKLDIGLGSMIGVGYRNVQRLHSNFEVNDYKENRVDELWYQSIGRQVRLSFENELRFRDYTNVPLDTTFQDYMENYFRGEVSLPFNSVLGFEFLGTLTKRDYKFTSIKSLPDYLLWEIEPELYFNISSDLRLSVCFYYSDQTHHKFLNRVLVSSVDAALSIPFEYYYTFGPSFTIEFFNIDVLMFNLRESFHHQR